MTIHFLPQHLISLISYSFNNHSYLKLPFSDPQFIRKTSSFFCPSALRMLVSHSRFTQKNVHDSTALKIPKQELPSRCLVLSSVNNTSILSFFKQISFIQYQHPLIVTLTIIHVSSSVSTSILWHAARPTTSSVFRLPTIQNLIFHSRLTHKNVRSKS